MKIYDIQTIFKHVASLGALCIQRQLYPTRLSTGTNVFSLMYCVRQALGTLGTGRLVYVSAALV
jgi:Leu/Phe-tRNA-protein transferase